MEKKKRFSNKPMKLKNESGNNTPMIPHSSILEALINIAPTEVIEGKSYGLPTLTLRYDNVETKYGNINGVFYAVNIEKYENDCIYNEGKLPPKLLQMRIMELSNRASKYYRVMNSKIEGTITVDGITEELKHIDVDILEHAASVHKPSL